MAPVFSLVLDKDVSEDLALLYPELYKDLTKVSWLALTYSANTVLHSFRGTDILSREDRWVIKHSSLGSPSACIKVFLHPINQALCHIPILDWYPISGGIIMLLSLLLFESEFLHIVAISYTALVLNELIMVSLEINTWHSYMILSEFGTALIYFGSMAVLPAYFGAFSSPFFDLCHLESSC